MSKNATVADPDVDLDVDDLDDLDGASLALVRDTLLHGLII